MNEWELDILNSIHGLSCPFLDSLSITLANIRVLWLIITIILLCVKKTRWVGVVFFVALIVQTLVCDYVLKPIADRPRPCEFAPFEMIVAAPSSSSFPSGHTMTAFTAATVLAVFVRKWSIPMIAFAFLMGFSRMYLYVHWPTDVIAGAMFGIIMGLIISWLFIRFVHVERLPSSREKKGICNGNSTC